ncbi:unnamed protein product [Heligmosomoides polygyrus]|uniref:Formin_GBD_N domain-containing protein n=1 Tax=Heligmosomoides polygyrus TaxID=6339 RepID=A0A183GJG2_HELPZ|nr:unnamed protein product [Heligmosomoides polygyrus]
MAEDTHTCRVQYVDDSDPFAPTSNAFLEPMRPVTFAFRIHVTIADQLPELIRTLRAPHKVTVLTHEEIAAGPMCAAVLGPYLGQYLGSWFPKPAVPWQHPSGSCWAVGRVQPMAGADGRSEHYFSTCAVPPQYLGCTCRFGKSFRNSAVTRQDLLQFLLRHVSAPLTNRDRGAVPQDILSSDGIFGRGRNLRPNFSRGVRVRNLFLPSPGNPNQERRAHA